MQSMLDACEKYGAAWDIKWNPGKTQLLKTGQPKAKDRGLVVKFCGEDLKVVQEIKYLGVEIRGDLKSNTHIARRRQATIRASFALEGIGGNEKRMSPKLRAFLYKTYARPILLYGVENASLNQKEASVLKTTEGNIVKRLLGVSFNSRTTHLLAALDLEPLQHKVEKEKCSFFLRLSENDLTRKLTNELIGLNLTATRNTLGLHDEINSLRNGAISTTPVRPEWQNLNDEYAQLLNACYELIEDKQRLKAQLFSHGLTHSIQTALINSKSLVKLLTKSYIPSNTHAHANDNMNGDANSTNLRLI